MEEGVGPFGSALEIQRQGLEINAVAEAQGTGDFVLADGLYHGSHPRTAGMAKRHVRKYLTDRQYRIIGDLDEGFRTPIFKLPGDKWSWYLRLERTAFGHWSGIVRLETSAPLEDAVKLANLYSAVLPRLKSNHLTEPRAPENLLPIAALERALRQGLGDEMMVQRAVSDLVRRSREHSERTPRRG